MEKTLVTTVKHFFAQCVFMSNIHYKAYYRLQKRQRLHKKIAGSIAGTTMFLIILELIVVKSLTSLEVLSVSLSVLSIAGLVLTGGSLLFTIFSQDDISEVKINHRLAAEAYKELRDSYMLLIEEVLSDGFDQKKVRTKSRKYQSKYSNIGKYSPTTDYEDYKLAQSSLGLNNNSQEEFTWTNEQIDRFLPEKLRDS